MISDPPTNQYFICHVHNQSHTALICDDMDGLSGCQCEYCMIYYDIYQFVGKRVRNETLVGIVAVVCTHTHTHKHIHIYT